MYDIKKSAHNYKASIFSKIALMQFMQNCSWPYAYFSGIIDKGPVSNLFWRWLPSQVRFILLQLYRNQFTQDFCIKTIMYFIWRRAKSKSIGAHVFCFLSSLPLLPKPPRQCLVPTRDGGHEQLISNGGRFKGAQAWDIRRRDFCSNQTYMDRWLMN